jgi:hypothetical protein
MPAPSKAVDAYLAKLPPESRAALQAIRETILRNLGPGYEEGMQYGGVGYFVPHSVYPPGYHCDPKQPLPLGGIVARKNYLTLGLMPVYMDPAEKARFRKEWKATGRKLDMGAVCIKFRRLEDVPLDVVGRAVARVPAKAYIALYEKLYGTTKAGKAAVEARAKAKGAAKPKASAAKGKRGG